MKKYLSTIFAIITLTVVLSIDVFAGYMYSRDGEYEYIYSWEEKEYIDSGNWSFQKPVTMYAPDGRTYNVFPNEIEAYKSVGWYTEPVLEVYSLDRRSLVIPRSKLSDYKAVGWYEKHEIFITMYAPDGRTIDVFTLDVDSYKAVGWYTEPFVEVYAADGRSIYIFESQLEAYMKVGWYSPVNLSKPNGSHIEINPFNTATISKYKAQGWYEDFVVYATDGRTATVPVYKLNSYLSSGWMRGVMMFSADGRTISVSPYQVEAYKLVGWHTAFDVNSIENGTLYIDVHESDVITDDFYVRYYDINGNPINNGTYGSEYIFYNSYNKKYYITDLPTNAAALYITKSSYDVNFETISYDNVYYFCNYITMYSDDGRSIQVPELQFNQYEAVGWRKPVTMYAADGRNIKVPHYQVDAYKAVGWYDALGYAYHFAIVPEFNNYYSVKDYDNAMYLIDLFMEYYTNTEYEQSLISMKNKAMDAWRKQTNGPLAYTGYSVSENSIGTPEVTLNFTNVSYKKVVAFKVKFDCYNIFGSYESSYYDYYYTDSADLNSAESASYTWTLYGADSVNTVKNIRVTEVVYSDGTKWYR